MNIRNSSDSRALSRAAQAGRIALALVFIHSLTVSPALWAGAYIFAGEQYGIDIITHPTGYTGTGGILNVGVCIDPSSLNAQDLVIPVKNNITVWNELQPIADNVELNAVSGIDAESVLLHEMGHCIGLAHVNAASESGLSQNDYTKATDGANDQFDVNAGPDGVIGSHDDIRGDDVNLHWFNPANDPFMLPVPTPVDTTQYKRDIAFLPAGDSFAQNASRAVASAMGYPYSEAVMQQGTYGGETQRELVSDDASTIMLAGSGLDERAGTPDDYRIMLSYEGITTGPNCGITVIMENMSGLAYCSTGGSFVGSGHVRITSASIHLGAGYTYTFNTELRGSGNQAPVADNDTAGVDEDSSTDIAVLGNDSDPDGDLLTISGVSNPPHGTAAVNPDETIHYAPDANYNGADSFSYTVEDGHGGADSATVSITVSPVNDLPVAANDVVSMLQDTTIDIPVLANDSDPDGDILDVSAAGPAGFGTVINKVSYVTYQPNPGASGQDSFSYTASDGKGGSDTATVTVNVAAANQSPVAAFTISCSGLGCDVDATTSSDPDGTIVNYAWNFGDGATGSGRTASHTYGVGGIYTVTLTVTDDLGATDSTFDSATATATATPNYALSDWSTVQGSLSGTYQATFAADGSVESVTETHSGGKPQLRSDGLEHIWQFNLTGGNHVFHLDATADFPAGDADSEFLFQWSTNVSGGWQTMLTLSAAASGFQSHDIGAGVAGPIFVRVVDADSALGNTVYSVVRVDRMYFDSPQPPSTEPDPAGNPNPADFTVSVPVNVTLSWSAGAGAASHDVYLGTASGSLVRVSSDQAGTTYDPGPLAADTTYFWRVDGHNSVGTTVGEEWQFTTRDVSGPTELIIDSITLGTVNAGKGSKRGQAVVTVVDDLGDPVGGATVTGHFTGSYSDSGSGLSGADGTAELTTSGTAKGGVSFTFCVDDVSGPLPYNGTQNCTTY